MQRDSGKVIRKQPRSTMIVSKPREEEETASPFQENSRKRLRRSCFPTKKNHSGTNALTRGGSFFY